MPVQFTNPGYSPDSFIGKYLALAENVLPGAALEIQEAYALALLAAASHGIAFDAPARLANEELNLYFMIHGQSFYAMKSACMKLAKKVQRLAMPGVLLPDTSSTEGMLSAMLDNDDGRPSVWLLDEMHGLFTAMSSLTYTAQTRRILLELFEGTEFKHRRTDKRGKTDMIHVKNAHLTVVGNVTSAVMAAIDDSDIVSGLLGRFIIIMANKGNFNVKEQPFDQKLLNAVVHHLSKVYQASSKMGQHRRNHKRPNLKFSIPAEWELETYLKGVMLSKSAARRTESETTLSARLVSASRKVAALIALSRIDHRDLYSTKVVEVTEQDVLTAISACERWRKSAYEFCKAMNEKNNPINVDIGHVVEYLSGCAEQMARKSSVLRHFKIVSRDAVEIEKTMVQRDIMQVMRPSGNGQKSTHLMWKLRDQSEWKDEPPPPPMPTGSKNVTVSIAQGVTKKPPPKPTPEIPGIPKTVLKGLLDS